MLDHYWNELLDHDCASLTRTVTRSRLQAPWPLDCIAQADSWIAQSHCFSRERSNRAPEFRLINVAERTRSFSSHRLKNLLPGISNLNFSLLNTTNICNLQTLLHFSHFSHRLLTSINIIINSSSSHPSQPKVHQQDAYQHHPHGSGRCSIPGHPW